METDSEGGQGSTWTAQTENNVFSSYEHPTVRMVTELGCQRRTIIAKISPLRIVESACGKPSKSTVDHVQE